MLRSKGGIGGTAACRRSRQHQLRCVGSMSQGKLHLRLLLRFHEIDLRPAVVHAVGNLPGGQAEVHRAENQPRLMARQIGEHKFRTVVQLHHDYITLAESGAEQPVSKPVCLCVQLRIVPASTAFQIRQRRPAAKPLDVPEKSAVPCVAVFKLLLKLLQRTLSLIHQAIPAHLLQKLFQLCDRPFQSIGRAAVLRRHHHLCHLPQRCCLVLPHTVDSMRFQTNRVFLGFHPAIPPL
mgnify:CR=1 FL=1